MRDLWKLIVILAISYVQLSASEVEEQWTGRWFPADEPKNHLKSNQIPMGSVENCDDGKTHLEVDYGGSSEEYTCFEDRLLYLPNPSTHPILEHDLIPKAYHPPHYCMNETITYKHHIPSFGGHRPVWPRYGEYNYLPPQRWVHSLEHGAIVMLYHPCANHNDVALLKDIVRNCLFRHIITASQLLPPERPLSLLAWGNRLLMSKFDPKIALKFITTYANNAPETTARDGQYSLGLLNASKIISDEQDMNICEKFTDADAL